MRVETRLAEALRQLGEIRGLQSISELARSAGVSWPTAKRYLDRMGLFCEEGLLSAETRDGVLRAAEEVFARDGFSGSSVQEIAAQAGVSRQLIYRHFRSKEHLFAALIEEYLDLATETLRDDIETAASLCKDIEGILSHLLLRFQERLDSKPYFSRLFVEYCALAVRQDQRDLILYLENRSNEVGARAISDLQARGFVSADLDPTALRILWTLVIDGLAFRHALEPQDDGRRDVIAGLARLLGRAAKPVLA